MKKDFKEQVQLLEQTYRQYREARSALMKKYPDAAWESTNPKIPRPFKDEDGNDEHTFLFLEEQLEHLRVYNPDFLERAVLLYYFYECLDKESHTNKNRTVLFFSEPMRIILSYEKFIYEAPTRMVYYYLDEMKKEVARWYCRRMGKRLRKDIMPAEIYEDRCLDDNKDHYPLELYYPFEY